MGDSLGWVGAGGVAVEETVVAAAGADTFPPAVQASEPSRADARVGKEEEKNGAASG